MIEELDMLERQAREALEQVDSLESLLAWRTQWTGKKSALSSASQKIGQLSPAERPAFGQRFGAVRAALTELEGQIEQRLKTAQLHGELEEDAVDVTLPGRPAPVGRLHPSTLSLRRIEAIFAEMGFQVWESREVESDEYNFELLNMPPFHPARDMQDTFYVKTEDPERKVVMRTHTSPGQIHAMRALAPEPIRIILPGKVYRFEQVTARSEMMFHQVEGLAIGPNITMSDLKGTLSNFARRMFGANAGMRFRPSYFPFTEPSVEVDVECFLCHGEGCRICKYSGWLEILGAGMVHPTVLRNGGYDPAKVSGFAFGMGPERQTMLRFGIDDIRWFFSNDTRFLEQFG
ncbi:MAG TPA: phenylalanine--tRNA ligase subunit alpha [Herpetosiphonaceae bacterium]